MRLVFVALKTEKAAARAQPFLKAPQEACPIKTHKLLTDNGKQFTDRQFVTCEREPNGNHEFDQMSKRRDLELRLTKHRTPPEPRVRWRGFTAALRMS